MRRDGRRDLVRLDHLGMVHFQRKRNTRILPEPEIFMPLLLIWLPVKWKPVKNQARRMKR